MNVIYVITWRYSDGSGSGAICAHTTQSAAKAMLDILNDQNAGREYTICAVPSDHAAKETTQ